MACPCGSDCSQGHGRVPGGGAREHMGSERSKRPSEGCLAFSDGSLTSHMALLRPYSDWLDSPQLTQIHGEGPQTPLLNERHLGEFATIKKQNCHIYKHKPI